MTKKLFIRVDSDDEIGLGHIMRCYAIAEEMKKRKINSIFITKKISKNILKFLKDHGYVIYKIKNQISSHYLKNSKNSAIKFDAFNTIKKIKKENNSNNLLVVDNYDLDEKWESMLGAYVSKIIVIDDLANRHHYCDLLIDQNLVNNMRKRYDKLIPKKCEKLLGPKYALLRSEFVKQRKNLKKRDGKLRKILVSFGGSDPTNESSKVLDSLKILNYHDIKVDIIAGPLNPNKKLLKQKCAYLSNVTFHSQTNRISKLMKNADLLIGAGGSSIWERCCLGLPSIVTILSEDQYSIVKTLEEKDCIINLGNAKKLSPIDYANAIKKLEKNTLCKMSLECLKLVDGKGASRVSEKILYT